MNLEALRRSVLLAGYERPPYLRTYRGAVWTVATNGHALIAVRERLTENLDGPLVRIRELGKFERTPVVVELDSLRRFLDIDRKPIGDVSSNEAAEPVLVLDAVVNRLLLRRLLKPLPAQSVKLRAELGGRRGGALRIDGHGFIAVCMGMVRNAPRATFRGGRRAA